MDHRPIIRDTDHRVAVLMVHGIASTPAHFRQLVPVIPEDWTLHNIILEGHDKTIREFGASRLKIWRQQALDEAQSLLQSHEKLIVIGHSMGTLFALRMAMAYPDRIPFLFLLNVPSRPWAPYPSVRSCLRAMRGDIDGDITARYMRADTAMTLEPFRRYSGWVPRLAELLVEVGQVRRLLPKLPVPVYAFQSRHDELVSSRAFRDLERIPHCTIRELAYSGHFHYDDRDAQNMQALLRALIENL